MKNLILLLLVLFGIEQVMAQDGEKESKKEPVFNYAGNVTGGKEVYYTPAVMYDSINAIASTTKGSQLIQIYLNKTKQKSLKDVFAKAQNIKVKLEKNKWRNTVWIPEENTLESFLGKTIDTLVTVGAFIDGKDTIVLYKASCGNPIDIISEKIAKKEIKDEDLPAETEEENFGDTTVQNRKKKEKVTEERIEEFVGEGKDVLVDTSNQKVYVIDNGTTNNYYYYGDGSNYQPYGNSGCYSPCNFSSSVWIAWGWCNYSSMYSFSCGYPNINIYNNYSYVSYYEYNENKLPVDPGGRVTPPGNGNGGSPITPGGQGDGTYYGHRNGTANDGSNPSGNRTSPKPQEVTQNRIDKSAPATRSAQVNNGSGTRSSSTSSPKQMATTRRAGQAGYSSGQNRPSAQTSNSAGQNRSTVGSTSPNTRSVVPDGGTKLRSSGGSPSYSGGTKPRSSGGTSRSSGASNGAPTRGMSGGSRGPR